MSLRFLFCIVFLGVFLSSCTSNKFEIYHKNMSCKKVNKFSVEERNQNYPYNKSSRIAFVSFLGKIDKLPKKEKIELDDDEIYFEEVYTPLSVMIGYFNILKEDFSRYNPKDFEESIDLDEYQKNELTDLIFNFGYRKYNGKFKTANCYTPRNAILFFDGNDELFEFVEICFECYKYRTSNDELFDLGEDCSDKTILLQNLFSKVGIKYGVETE